jgi:hypothetical protein
MSKIITNTEVEQFKKMEANGYKNSDNIEGKMFPKLWSLG